MNGRTTGYGWDDTSNLVSITYPGQTTPADGNLQVFDPAQRLCWTSPTATTGACETPASDATTFDYDERGNRVSKTFPSGTSSSYGYDAENRMTSAKVSSLAGANSSQLQLLAQGATRVADTTSSTAPGTCNGAPCVRFDATVPVDVTGFYFEPTFVPGLNFWPTTPEIVVQSATGTGTCNGSPCGALAAGVTEVTVAGVGGVPATGVSAVTVSVIANNTTGGSLRMAPNGDASAGGFSWDTLPGAGTFTVAVSSNGTIDVELANSSEVTMSVVGWWKTPTSQDTGTGLELLDAPERLVDTRDGTGTCSGAPCDTLVALAPAVEVDVAGQVGLGDDVAAVMLSVTVIDPAGPGLVGLGATSAVAAGVLLFDDDTHASMIVPVDPATGTIGVASWVGTDVTIDVIGSFTPPTVDFSYEYDATGLRSAKQQDADNTAGHSWRKEFTWSASGGLPLLLAEHEDNQTSYVVYGPGGSPLYQITKTGAVIYLHQDHQGSTRLVTNPNGTTRGTLTYDAYGKTTSNTSPWAAEQPLLTYTGQYTDTETGLIYLRARHYDPTTGQFTSLDPLVAVTEEPYGYVYGNPANRSDPAGLCVAGLSCPLIPIIDVIAGAAGSFFDGVDAFGEMSDLVDLIERDMGAVDYGSLAAAGVHLAKGMAKFHKAAALAAAPDPTFVTKGLAVGFAFSGAMNFLRAYRLIKDCTRPLSKEERTLKSNLERLLFGVMPKVAGSRWDRFVAAAGFP